MVERFFTVFLSNVHHVPVVGTFPPCCPSPAQLLRSATHGSVIGAGEWWPSRESVLKMLPVNQVTLL